MVVENLFFTFVRVFFLLYIFVPFAFTYFLSFYFFFFFLTLSYFYHSYKLSRTLEKNQCSHTDSTTHWPAEPLHLEMSSVPS